MKKNLSRLRGLVQFIAELNESYSGLASMKMMANC